MSDIRPVYTAKQPAPPCPTCARPPGCDALGTSRSHGLGHIHGTSDVPDLTTFWSQSRVTASKEMVTRSGKNRVVRKSPETFRSGMNLCISLPFSTGRFAFRFEGTRSGTRYPRIFLIKQ